MSSIVIYVPDDHVATPEEVAMVALLDVIVSDPVASAAVLEDGLKYIEGQSHYADDYVKHARNLFRLARQAQDL